MSQPLTKAALSPARARLVELMQRLDFGTLEDLVVRDGEPVFDPGPRIVRDVKLGNRNGSRPEVLLDDFALKAEVVDLFAQFDSIDTQTTLWIEVKHGLPFRMKIEEDAA